MNERVSGATSTGVDPRVSAMLCYAAWWITGLLFLFLEREHRGVRFHAAQSLVVFGTLSLLMGAIAVMSVTTLLLVPSLFRPIWSLNSLVWLSRSLTRATRRVLVRSAGIARKRIARAKPSLNA